MRLSNLMEPFQLGPIKAARVSEISETTAAAPVPPEERINFHIGNPLLDKRQTSAYLRLVLGLKVENEQLNDSDIPGLLAELDWEQEDIRWLEFLIRTINLSSPYLPRGGFLRQDPLPIIRQFQNWLKDQPEPLNYNTGEQSARREIILSSGGVMEAIRLLLFVFSSQLKYRPAIVITYQLQIPSELQNIPELVFHDLPPDEKTALESLNDLLTSHPAGPVFLLVGSELTEVTRRQLRLLSLEQPIFFVEANNAPNHRSLAREVKLADRVLRILTPGIFNPRLESLSTIFIVGNADFLKAFENMHFKLKGTPSASEVELLDYLLTYHQQDFQNVKRILPEAVEPQFEGLGFGTSAELALDRLSKRVEELLDTKLHRRAVMLTDRQNILNGLGAAADIGLRITGLRNLADSFRERSQREVWQQLVKHIDNPDWIDSLQASFLVNFGHHQQQYSTSDCVVVSGSSRTALGIIGYHCGITEIVIPDLSWSYEQCFPKVHAIPLEENYALDPHHVISKLQFLLEQDADWGRQGGLMITNPHNATSRILSENTLREMITFCLKNDIWVIEDIAYQNVVPSDQNIELKTARQIANELVQEGLITRTQADRLIVVHSLSKTDCMAGARLAVAEIRHEQIRTKFQAINRLIQPNLAAILLSYLFYRNPPSSIKVFWLLRNILLHERSEAIQAAIHNLPPERNPFGLTILPPEGSMYPLLQVSQLPNGISLDWLASSLARQGIGLLPLSTFARTERGFDIGRKSFRLTLGGSDDGETLLVKTRRLLIDLNRLIAEEDARYNLKSKVHRRKADHQGGGSSSTHDWDQTIEQIKTRLTASVVVASLPAAAKDRSHQIASQFLEQYLPDRLDQFSIRYQDYIQVSDALLARATAPNSGWLARRLEQEFSPDSLIRRQELFLSRMFDRTVHPTQTLSIHTEQTINRIIAALLRGGSIPSGWYQHAATSLLDEYLGKNVAITSRDEADEVLLDLAALTSAENFTEAFTEEPLETLLSFWSDWDGSNRPSGQGQQLVGNVVIENVRQLSRILLLLKSADPTLPFDPKLLARVDQLTEQNQRFSNLLSSITQLTHQLEQRFRGLLPLAVDQTAGSRWMTRVNLRQDPVKLLLQHNDRYERRMLELRHQRKDMLEFYFSLNQALRLELTRMIPAIQRNSGNRPLLIESALYRDLLKRIVITPRIHQSLITARDQFAIDTTVFNLDEINAIAGRYGSPGMILALQVSMSTRPEALITLDRKMQVQRERVLRMTPEDTLPAIWLIPLFEDTDSVQDIHTYLDRIWDYATQSRRSAQTPRERFAEIISEVFIAGSDLSQQVGQAAGHQTYRQVKFRVTEWLARHYSSDLVRVKLGSGESMQRQGGYYAPVSGQPAFSLDPGTERRLSANLAPAARQSARYAITPLLGVFRDGDLRTYQSHISELLRFLPVRDYAALLSHVHSAQRIHHQDLIRAAETITESRLTAQNRALKDLERLTIGTQDHYYQEFVNEVTSNFRHILYGMNEDVIGIHAISYFVGRSLPQLRDRPTSRRRSAQGKELGQQILTNIAEIVPFARHGSLLRAITHNQAQTAVMGINQLTTGLFRSLDLYTQRFLSESERHRIISDHLLPELPVLEILNTLRLYHDRQGHILRQIETAMPAGNSAMVALREDQDAMTRFIPQFQRELIRRHGLNPSDFFSNGAFMPSLLPALRPDLAVLLQRDLFNTSLKELLDGVDGKVPKSWQDQVSRLLEQPERIQLWRNAIWNEIGGSIYQRVQSFSELALAISSLPAPSSIAASTGMIRNPRVPPALSGFLRSAHADDEMRLFLVGTLETLNSIAANNIEVPITIVRAMNDIERIAQLEELSPPNTDQVALRYWLLMIARLAGENG